MEDYNYVINLDSYLIYQSTEVVDLVVRNIFPKLMVIEERKLKDYSSSMISQTKVSFALCPLKYGMEDIKKMERVILRGILINLKTDVSANRPFAVVHSLGDNVNFRSLKGLYLDNGSYKDIDLGMFACSKYRQYMFAFAGMIDHNSQISFIETMIDKEYNNTKMR